jgi:hypothetical protein
MKYFRKEEDPNARLPKNFIEGFLEVCICQSLIMHGSNGLGRDGIRSMNSTSSSAEVQTANCT